MSAVALHFPAAPPSMVLSSPTSPRPQGRTGAAPHGMETALHAGFSNNSSSLSSLSIFESSVPALFPANAANARERRPAAVISPPNATLSCLPHQRPVAKARPVHATDGASPIPPSSLHALGAPTEPPTPHLSSDTSRCPFPDCVMRPSLSAYFKHVS